MTSVAAKSERSPVLRERPLVSILMNCYNGEPYLSEALDSIVAQTYTNWELVFWDNQSTDRSAEIVKSYRDDRIKYFYAPTHTNLGGGRARAWPHLRGEFIAVLDTDDLWLPSKLETQLPLFEDPEVAMVISDTIFFDGTREWRLYGHRLPPTGWVFEDLLTSYYVSLETLMFRRSTAAAMAQGFDPDFSHLADFDLVVRLSREGKLAIAPQVLGKWRIRADSESWTRPQQFNEEKRRFLKKRDAEWPDFQTTHARAREEFRHGIVRSEALQAMLAGDGRRGWRGIRRELRLDPKTLVVAMLCLIPGAGKLLRRGRRMLGLRPI